MYGLRGFGDTKALATDCTGPNCSVQASYAANPPALINGTPVVTQYLDASNVDLATVSALQSKGYAVVLYDPATGQPTANGIIAPTDNAISVLQQAGVTPTNPDQGASYAYSQLFVADMAKGGGAPAQADVFAQMAAQGFTPDQISVLTRPAPTSAPPADYYSPTSSDWQQYSAQPGSSTAASPAPSPPVINPVLASALSAPSAIQAAPPVQTPSTSAASLASAVAVTPAVSNTLLFGGLAVVGILIMMSTGGKS